MKYEGTDLPLVSVLLPSFNHADYVIFAIDSIVKQSYPNIEFLVLDDGSSDGSYDLICTKLLKVQHRFQRVYCNQQTNSGVAVTLNRLLSEAKGRYIYIIASDDMALPDSISILVHALTHDSASVMAVGDAAFIDKNNKRIKVDASFLPMENGIYATMGEVCGLNNRVARHTKHFGEYKDLLFGNYIPNGYLIRRDIIEKIGGYDPSLYLEDWYMNLQLSKYGSLKYLPTINFLYRIHESNTIHSDFFTTRKKNIFWQMYKREWKYCFIHGYFLHLFWAIFKLNCPKSLIMFVKKQRLFLNNLINHKL